MKNLGHIPGRPLGGRHGMVFGQIPAPPAVGTSVPLVPGAYRIHLISTTQLFNFFSFIIFKFFFCDNEKNLFFCHVLSSNFYIN